MADQGRVLFEVPIGTTGNIVVTEPATKVYLVTWRYPPDNRLRTEFLQAVMLTLDIIEVKLEPGVVVTTSGIEKFYSNGLDLEHVRANPRFFDDSLYPYFRRFLTYPMPTVALINGHCFAGALITSMMQDYRVMNPHKGYLCLNELELGAPLAPPLTSIFREKLSAATLRKLILEAYRFKPLEALNEGMVDHLGGLPEALALIAELNLVKKAAPGLSGQRAYGVLKREMWRETIANLESFGNSTSRNDELEAKQRKEAEAKAKQWEVKPKL